jgi:3,4-dihydroxy 2-butanone 4-phosphate synthase/GTP cyclohydrolase II
MQEGGILVYLDQEGRGAGQAIKAAAYRACEDTGIDSFEFYRSLGVPDDGRRYDFAVSVLRDLDVDTVRLLTNNPRKVAALRVAGFEVERVPLIVDHDPASNDYLSSKRRHGYLI